MDLGIKTLAQLSAESKEKRFVSIDVGSKISGYTKEYLERLCRLKKIECRMWTNGQFAMELEALLGETHTILLSYDDITFVDKKELSDPTDSPNADSYFEGISPGSYVKAGSPQTESPTEKRRSPVRAPGSSNFSYVGRAFVSDSGQEVDGKENETNMPMTVGAVPPLVKEDGVTLAPVSNDTSIEESRTEAPIVSVTSSIPKEETKRILADDVVVPIIKGTPLPVQSVQVREVPVVNIKETSVPPIVEATSQSIVKQEPVPPAPIQVLPTKKETIDVVPVTAPSPVLPVGHKHFVSEIPLYAVPHKPTKVSSVTPKPVTPLSTPVGKVEEKDEWDKMLFQEEAVAPLAPLTPKNPEPIFTLEPLVSPYHPIKTSVDATVHHESLPLFPTVGSAVPQKRSDEVIQKPSRDVHLEIPNLGDDKRVVVFAPEKYGKSKIAAQVAVVAPVSQLGSNIPPPIARPDILPSSPTLKSIVQNLPHLPMIRVMPQVPMESTPPLPAITSEHHLVLREKYPILKSTGLNLAFAVFFLGTSLVLLSGILNSPLVGNSVSYVAGVAAAVNQGSLQGKATQAEENPAQESASAVLPFSDEIVVANGTNGDSIFIQPVFKDNAGGAYEYTVTSGRPKATSSPDQ